MSRESQFENFSNRTSYYDHEKQNAFDPDNYPYSLDEGTEIDLIIDMREENPYEEIENLSQRNFIKNKNLDRKFGENLKYLNYNLAKNEHKKSESDFYDKYAIIGSNSQDSYFSNSKSELLVTPNRKPKIIEDEFGPNKFLNKKHDRNEKESYDKKSEILRNFKKSAIVNNMSHSHHSPVFVSTFLNSPSPKTDLQSLINQAKINHPKPSENKISYKPKFEPQLETILLDDEPQDQKLPNTHTDQSFSGPANSFSQISHEKEHTLKDRLKILEDKIEKLEKDKDKARDLASKSLQENSFRENNLVTNYSNTNNTLIKLFGAAMKLIIHIDETVNTKLDSKCEKCEKFNHSEKEKEGEGSQNLEKFFTNKLYSTDKIEPAQIADMVNSFYNSSYNYNLENESNFIYSSPLITSPLKEANYKEKYKNEEKIFNKQTSFKNKNDCYSKNQMSSMTGRSNITSPTNEELKTTLPPSMLSGIQSPPKNNLNSDYIHKNYKSQQVKCYNCRQPGHKANQCQLFKN
jgi:hypothetical protein